MVDSLSHFLLIQRIVILLFFTAVKSNRPFRKQAHHHGIVYAKADKELKRAMKRLG